MNAVHIELDKRVSWLEIKCESRRSWATPAAYHTDFYPPNSCSAAASEIIKVAVQYPVSGRRFPMWRRIDGGFYDGVHKAIAKYHGTHSIQVIMLSWVHVASPVEIGRASCINLDYLKKTPLHHTP